MHAKKKSNVEFFISMLVSGEILGIIGPIPNVAKSNQFHVVIFWFFFIYLRQIP